MTGLTKLTKSRWLKSLGIGTLALIGLGAVTLAPTPASARVFVSFGVPTYGYAPYPYYSPYYGYGYGYPYGGVTFAFGPHHHHHHWHDWD